MPNMLLILLEIVFSGSIETASAKKAPMVVRVLLAGVLCTVYMGLFALLLFVGMKENNGMLIVIAFIVLLSVVASVFLKIKEIKDRRRMT